jgi:hypothetical protein
MHLDPGSYQEACTPMVEEPKMYYKTEKECEKISSKKRKEIKDIALQYKMMVTEVYSTCIKEGNNS